VAAPQWAHAELEVESIALWLLRIGIDHSGQLSLTGAWDVAVRAAVLADLKRAGRISESDVVRPHRLAFRRPIAEAPLQPEDCGMFASIVSAAATEIRVRAAVNSANSDPTW
jgi:hypothetical protein